MSNNKNGWLILVSYTLLIFVTLPWVRQVWDFVGDRNGTIILAIAYTASVGIHYFRNRSLLFIGIICAAIFAVYKLIPLPIERIHLIEYGIMGWLAYKVLGKKGFIYIFVVGILDEVIQGILPSRVFDMHDIYMNLFGGTLGVIIGIYER